VISIWWPKGRKTRPSSSSGDVVGHGLHAAQRAAFVRTAFASTAPFSDDPRKLLGWANAALVERAGTGHEYVTAACVTYLPDNQILRWAYAGHPPALWMHDGQELAAPRQGPPLGLEEDPEYVEGSLRARAAWACCSTPTG
jgi:serine phosphatase RsbU (regulator of sigma subunit)